MSKASDNKRGQKTAKNSQGAVQTPSAGANPNPNPNPDWWKLMIEGNKAAAKSSKKAKMEQMVIKEEIRLGEEKRRKSEKRRIQELQKNREDDDYDVDDDVDDDGEETRSKDDMEEYDNYVLQPATETEKSGEPKKD
ncbi:hypothetical protein LPJ72_004617 [Coemansia sp. Benny D160-2]|nr:hypothetical protein LPJ72_004617 [Coemansia sp. Benny D160-2]